MLPGNKTLEPQRTTEEFLKKKGGWARVEECAKEYSKGSLSKRTTFYRWRKKIEKNRTSDFQILPLPGNITFLGLRGADPNKIAEAIESDQNIRDRVRAFSDRTKQGKPQEGGEIFTEAEAKAVAHFYQHGSRYMRNYSRLIVWLKRGARLEEKPKLEL